MIPIRLIPLISGKIEVWSNGCEQFAVHLTYDMSKTLAKWPDAVPSVAYERADGAKYPHTFVVEGEILHIPLMLADTAIPGLCKCVVTMTDVGGKANSVTYHGNVTQGIDTLGEEPDEPMQGIIEQVNGAAVRAEGAAESASANALVSQNAAETANAAAMAAGEHAENAASAAERSENGASRAEDAAHRAENAEVPVELIERLIKGYLEENPPEAPVQSVNGKTGVISLNANDVGALPADTKIPDAYTLPAATDDMLGGVKVGSGLNVAADGTVTASAASVGALPANYIPPVLSVNGKTGDVTLDAAAVGALASGGTANKAARIESDTLVVRSFGQWSGNIDAGGTSGVVKITPTAVSGYTFVCPCGYSMGSHYIMLVAMAPAGSVVNVWMKNWAGAAVSSTMDFYGLYRKN